MRFIRIDAVRLRDAPPGKPSVFACYLCAYFFFFRRTKPKTVRESRARFTRRRVAADARAEFRAPNASFFRGHRRGTVLGRVREKSGQERQRLDWFACRNRAETSPATRSREARANVRSFAFGRAPDVAARLAAPVVDNFEKFARRRNARNDAIVRTGNRSAVRLRAAQRAFGGHTQRMSSRSDTRG